MKFWWALALVLAPWGLYAQDLPVPSVTLVNTLANRPVFTYSVQGVVQTRSLAPGNRLSLPAGLFSGLGEKKLPFQDGSIYYLARLGATPRVYRLPSDQVLILNESGTAVDLSLGQPGTVSARLASGALALGSVEAPQGLQVAWSSGTDPVQSTSVAGGRVYRLILDSPQGTGITVSLVPWE
ncbi:MAG TPA: hypothetical protein VMB23_09815 [Spirochaetia bacterium]|jgi:hypothetical protein|nr:hypothetical protein [Spirochaetia bacterium]